MNHTIRRLTSADLIAYRAIRAEALRDHPEAFVETPDRFAARSNDDVGKMLDSLAVFAAMGPDHAIDAIVGLSRSDNPKEQHRGWLIQVYARPALRGTGMARRLIETAIENAREWGMLQIHLGVWTENEPALRLYQKLGFATYGTEPRYLFVNGRYVDEHLMVRFLDKAPGDQK
ncbi:MAG: GNAT family N-acetyltransferase [Candidatus Devosia phytovorans]|uniref:GNAT family N-acetyltransferase n=1 Tax=Candidatus Devosia phytovorans TaxID=3121372 RepID=A0AAJ5VUJ2_9HYPH|nr:GNAT family N-acetyltransferase [Devosia sp.]WEK04185.1 MAG: GNAT family N-acetyltransferase [Devosia sp.]